MGTGSDEPKQLRKRRPGRGRYSSPSGDLDVVSPLPPGISPHGNQGNITRTCFFHRLPNLRPKVSESATGSTFDRCPLAEPLPGPCPYSPSSTWPPGRCHHNGAKPCHFHAHSPPMSSSRTWGPHASHQPSDLIYSVFTARPPAKLPDSGRKVCSANSRTL